MRGMKFRNGMEVVGPPEMLAVLKGREEFTLKYVSEKGWDFDNLTIPQIMEIRAQDGWKTPERPN